MGQLVAALVRFAVLVEHSIHGADRSVVLAFIEQRGIHGGGRTIPELFFLQTGQHGSFILRIQGPGTGEIEYLGPARHRLRP